MNKVISDIKFNYLKDYVSFLLKQKINEASHEYLKLLQKANPPLEQSSFQSHEVHIEIIKNSLKEFFIQILENRPFNPSIDSNIYIQTNQQPELQIKTKGLDLFSINRIRRQLFVQFLPAFSCDCNQFVSIINELEEYFSLIEKNAFYNIDDPKEKINNSNEFLYSIINNSIDGIAAYDKELNVIEWNHVLEKHHGIKKEEILGKNIFEVLPAYSDSEEAKSTSRVLQGDKVFFTDRPYKTKDYGWYEVFMAPLYDKDEIIGILSVFRDISKRKENEEKLKIQQQELENINKELKDQREELEAANEELQENFSLLIATQDALKENEARLNEAQAVAHLGSWEHDIENNKIYWSDELKSIFGFHPDDQTFNYDTYLSLLYPDDREMVDQIVNRTMQTFESYSFEHRIIKKDGEIRWIQAQGKALVSENKIRKLKGTALDITQRKKAEEKLREEQHFIQKIADTTPNVITVFDLVEYKNIYFNRELYELLGYSKEEFEIIRKDKDFLKNLIHPEDFQYCVNYIESFKTYLENIPKEIEFRIKDVDGNYKWILAIHNVFKKSEAGYPIQIIGISRDITEKKEAENELLEREFKLKESQHLAKMGHWELDLKTNKINWSEGLYEIYGIEYLTPIDLESVKAHIFSNDYDVLISKIRHAYLSNTPYQIEYRIKHPKLGTRTLFSRGKPVVNEKNEVLKLKGITQDISERKKIEQELKESQKFIQAITDSVPNIIFVYDVINEKNIYTNRDLTTTLGYSTNDVNAMGKDVFRELVHEDDYPAILDRNKRVKISDGTENFEVFFRIKDVNDNWRWLRSLSKIFKYNSKGEPWQILGITEDVTDKKIAEEKLQSAYSTLQDMNLELARAESLLKIANNELEQRVEERTKELSEIILELKKTAEEQQKFKALVEKSINFISMADLEGNIIYINEGGLKLVNLDSKEEAYKTKIQDYFFEEDHKILFKKPFTTPGYNNQWTGEFLLKNFKTGQPISVFANAFRIEDPLTGEILALANVSHDLTDHKRKEEEIRSSREKLEAINIELNKKNEELLKTNIDLDNFVYTASHDLKSPISNLEGLLLAIKKPMDEKLNDQEKEIIKMMDRSIFKLKDTINALVEITKAQRSLEESKELISIPEVLDEVMLEIDKLILESNAEISLDLNVKTLLYAKINLHSIIYNLLSNAIKYRDKQRTLKVHVASYKEDGYIVLSIRDNGLGMNVNQQSKLFGMFRRFHSHVEGTGIGLYIIKRVIENNNGRIDVESEDGKGSCFKVFFEI